MWVLRNTLLTIIQIALLTFVTATSYNIHLICVKVRTCSPDLDLPNTISYITHCRPQKPAQKSVEARYSGGEDPLQHQNDLLRAQREGEH